MSESPHALIMPELVRLGHQLKKLRGSMPAGPAARTLGKSASWLSKVEAGEIRLTPVGLVRLLRHYGHGDDDPLTVRLLEQLTHLNARRWWEGLGGVVAKWDLAYLAFEDQASAVRTYELALIPGLLQTREYADALMRVRAAPETVALRLAARMRRQEILSRGVYLHALICEAALHFQVAGPAAHEEQLGHLVQRCDDFNITIQVVPYSAGAIAVGQSGFALLTLAGDAAPSVLSIEQQQMSTRLTQAPGDVANAVRVFNTLRAHALSVGASRDLIRRIA